MTDKATDSHSQPTADTPLALKLTEGLGLAPERAAFDRWLRDNGHCEDQHDDMLMPLQRSINNLMWSAWQAAVAVERERCAALADSMRIGMPGHTARHPVFLYRGDVGEMIRGA